MKEITTAERLGIAERQASLNRALMSDDQLGMIIRAHIHIEHEVIQFIRARIRPEAALDAITLDYAGRVKLAIALGLGPEFKAALSFVGTLRNRFAHRLETSITVQDANNFRRALGSESAVAVSAYVKAHASLRPSEQPMPFEQQEPVDQVICYVVTIWGAIAVAAARAMEELAQPS